MRKAFIERVTALAEADPSVFLITTDSGFHVLDDFAERFDGQYMNIGLCESATVGIAGGMAMAGRNVFIYGIATFVVIRSFEHIRDDLCFQKLPVTLVGVGQGLTYASEGATHHATDDIAILSALPGMTVLCPGDPVETAALVDAAAAWPGPVYLRLGKSGEPLVHDPSAPPDIEIGRAVTVREGGGVALIATGNMLATAREACDRLVDAGLDPTLVSMHTVKPIDRDAVMELAGRCELLVTIEEHTVIGGLGAAVGRVCDAEELEVRRLRIGIEDVHIDRAGSHAYMRTQVGLDVNTIVNRVLEAIGWDAP